jgi:Protein of unknown function (DUF1353)
MKPVMISSTRRGYLTLMAGAVSLIATGNATGFAHGKTKKAPYTKEEWMSHWMRTDAGRASDSPLHLGRFREPIYYLLDPISWTPNADQANRFEAVQVPKGFVSDLASIPRVFYSLLRPDGTYAYAAIIHDYLYWTQAVKRETADEILKNSMEDFEVDPVTLQTIFTAVRAAGQFAWDQNAKAKSGGEQRVLVQFPANARTEWSVWKKNKHAFASP